MDEKVLLFLNQYTNIKYVTYKKIINYLNNNIDSFFELKNEDFKKIGLRESSINKIIDNIKKYNYEEELEKIYKQNAKICCISDKDYPILLKNIYDPPILFYYKGVLNCNDCFSIIGTRKFTEYGKKVAFDFSGFLSNYYDIVSGFAYGIDTFSHTAAINNNKRTIAIIGTGLDICYPSINRNLYEQILYNGGAIFSEFKFGTKPSRENFPMRNRIISGISSGVLVVEAGEKSGTIITANCALEQGREVFVIPGSIYSPYSIGTNILVKNGANIVTCPEDILSCLNKNNKIKKKHDIKFNFNEEEKRVYDLISENPINVESIYKNLNKLKINEVNSILVLLELKGAIKNIGNMNYVIN